MFRHEIKALLTPVQAEILKAKISAICFADSHASESGQYNIKSIYFDTRDDKFLTETLDGVNSRHKYRIRKYNDDDSLLKLECKSTENGLKHKDADVISREEVEKILKRDYSFADRSHGEVISTFSKEAMRSGLHPVTIIGYDRVPFVYPVGNVRVTFDYNICATEDINVFFNGYNGLEIPICQGEVIAEIKYDEVLPGAIKEIINNGRIVNQSAFSKYANARLAFGNKCINL